MWRWRQQDLEMVENMVVKDAEDVVAMMVLVVEMAVGEDLEEINGMRYPTIFLITLQFF